MTEQNIKKELEKRKNLLTNRIKNQNLEPILASLIQGELIGINYALSLLSFSSDES